MPVPDTVHVRVRATDCRRNLVGGMLRRALTRAVNMTVRRSAEGAGGFEGGRSIPLPDRNVQYCVGWLMVPKPPGASCDRKRFPHPIRHSLDPSGPGFARLS